MTQTQHTEEQEIHRRIAEAVTAFQQSQISGAQCSINVSMQSDAVVITLRGVMSPAEKNYAKDRKARRLLERFYEELFDTTRPMLETSVQEILGQRVKRSRFAVDPESGDGVIVVTFAG